MARPLVKFWPDFLFWLNFQKAVEKTAETSKRSVDLAVFENLVLECSR